VKRSPFVDSRDYHPFHHMFKDYGSEIFLHDISRHRKMGGNAR
jgi:hypothetical protein